MGPTAQFIIAIMVAVTSLAGGSLAWPRITTQMRPKLLQDVHDIVMKTPIGKQTASVLGVSDEANAKPINVGQIMGDAVSGIKISAQQRVQTIIVGNAVNQLRAQFDKMPQDQKSQIQEILCKPPDLQSR
jgi:hypothetical protein